MSTSNFGTAQNVPIKNYSVNNFGQVQLEIEAEADKYYLLTALHQPNLVYETITSMTIGVNGTLIISEPGAAFPQQNYKITEHSIANPDDTDGDGIDDITEFNNLVTQAPLNFAPTIPIRDGAVSIDNYQTFSVLSSVVDNIPWAPFLNNQEFVKFAILNIDSDKPQVYFINSERHPIHQEFYDAIGANLSNYVSGEIVYNPNEILSNGAIGSYSFNYSFGASYTFENTRRAFELLIANMPYLQNNMQHFIGDFGEGNYEAFYKNGFVGSRVKVVLESEVFSDVDFIPFNKAEGFGFFREMNLDENPGSRDIVLYDALPNSLPRVGGIITSVVQTPLSHVNLRAIQDNVPNAYIKNPLQIDSIANLLGNYIYYKVEDDKYFIREATLDEVNVWYEKLRPTEPQIPERDLGFKEILPLDSIKFEMSTAFGAKCSNVATMRTFGFPDGTIPNGFGIPFYYYDEFMKFNNFYQKVEDMITDPDFISDLETRIDMLKDFRKEIKDAPMPQWMLDDLQAMHDAFPEGTAVRCRSSTNNEDLPGFSGAGLYTSKTQHLDEGHIQKSIKQVYASMWNFRAFDERDFYRVDHYIAAMGVLCHPNFEDEKSNGVGVSIDPIYQTENTFYLNTQVGEFLITNPDANSIPEEILLNEDPAVGYFILRESNLVNPGELVMDDRYLDQMRDYLKVIHDEFAILYGVVGADGFGMDIEYKVTAENRLIIKQARPWVSFWADIKATYDLGVDEISEPVTSAGLSDNELVKAKVSNKGLEDMTDFDISLYVDDQLVETISITDTIPPFSDAEYQFTVPQDFSMIGDYDVMAIVSNALDGYARNDSLDIILSKLHLLEGGITIGGITPKCGNEVEVKALVMNYGESTFINTEIEVVVNGLVVDTVLYDFGIPYLFEAEIDINVTDNLQSNENQITLNLIGVNGQQDAIVGNNVASTMTDLNSTYDYVRVVINADNFPEETSWQVLDELTNEPVAFGSLSPGTRVYIEDVCVDYNSCLSLSLFDSENDGICCYWGQGDFLLLNSAGDTLITNDGEFESTATELFCPNGNGCSFTTNITINNASDNASTDGMIRINTSAGLAPFQYSIDGGQTFVKFNTFSNLSAGDYIIMVKDASETCFYEETVTVDFDAVNSVNDFAGQGIKVYPNPTEDDLTIELEQHSKISGNLKIYIYDALGRLIQTDIISKNDNQSKAVISLSGYPSGSYFAKCYNDTFEKYFKVVKM